MPTATATTWNFAWGTNAWLVFVLVCFGPAQSATAQFPAYPAKEATAPQAITPPTKPEPLPPAYRPPTLSTEKRLSAPPPKFQGLNFQPPVYHAPNAGSTLRPRQPRAVAPALSQHSKAANPLTPNTDTKPSPSVPPTFQHPGATPPPKPRPSPEPRPRPIPQPSQPSSPARTKPPSSRHRQIQRSDAIFRLLQLHHAADEESAEVGTDAIAAVTPEMNLDSASPEPTSTNEFSSPTELNPPTHSYRLDEAAISTTSAELTAPESSDITANAIIASQTGDARSTDLTPMNTNPPTVAGGHDGYGSFHDTGCDPGCGCGHCVSPFSPDPNFSTAPFDPAWEWDVYDGKWFNCKQSPWIEWGRGIYKPGPVPPSPHFLGVTNPVTSSFLLYGDYRTAVAYNDLGNKDKSVWAHRLNLDFDFKFTATERIHAFWGPLDRGLLASRFEADDDKITFTDEFDEDFDTLFFEGDLGYIWGGFTDQYAPFDLPFVLGRFPLFFQNGVWLNEIIEGFAFTIPARHLRFPVIPNYEITYFFGFDDVASPAFGDDDNAANIYGVHGFFDMFEGYLELGHAYLDDTSGQGLSYRNFGISFTRRYFQRISNAMRVLVSTGQTPKGGAPQTADGTLLLIENAWVSRNPNYFVPYLNMFAGFGRPQSSARLINNVLVNTGINFETDFLTGYPTLDASGNDTWGGAVGLNWLGPDFSWQWIVELAMLQTHGDSVNRIAPGDQYAIGTRYQIPINYAWILRMDAMHGFLDDADDLTGARVELRWKF